MQVKIFQTNHDSEITWMEKKVNLYGTMYRNKQLHQLPFRFEYIIILVIRHLQKRRKEKAT